MNETVKTRAEPIPTVRIPLPIIAKLENITHSFIYSLTPEMHGDRFPSLPWEEHGKNPFCHDAAHGELDRTTKEVIKKGCGYSCCEVPLGAPNTIAVGPGEFATEKQRDHLQLIEEEGSYFGGSRVSCLTGRCNPSIDAKFNDCKWYPFFLIFNEDERLKLQVGTKCPMPTIAKTLHLMQTLKHAGKVIDQHPDWIEFLKRAHEQMSGYVEYDYTYLATMSAAELDELTDEKITINKIREGIRVLSHPKLEQLAPALQQDYIEQYASHMQKMKEQALQIFHTLKTLDIDFQRGISVENLITLAKACESNDHST